MRRGKPMPKTVGVRLSIEDRAKLDALCAATRRPPGEVLRLLVQQAQTDDVPTFRFGTSDQAPDEKKRP
jgi:hypothetical protein